MEEKKCDRFECVYLTEDSAKCSATDSKCEYEACECYATCSTCIHDEEDNNTKE